MALISQSGGRPEAYMPRRRSPSPVHRHRSLTPDRDRRRGDKREKEDERRDRDKDRRGRDENARDDEREGRSERRRASPQYDDYRRATPHSESRSQAPGRKPEHMYPNRNGGSRSFYSGHISGGSDFMEKYTPFSLFYDHSLLTFKHSRRMQREAQVVNIWPSSPKAPARDLYVSNINVSNFYSANLFFSDHPDVRSQVKGRRGHDLLLPNLPRLPRRNDADESVKKGSVQGETWIRKEIARGAGTALGVDPSEGVMMTTAKMTGAGDANEPKTIARETARRAGRVARALDVLNATLLVIQWRTKKNGL